MADPEVVAMGAIADALKDLDEAAARRVIEWASKRYGVAVAPAKRTEAPTGANEEESEFTDIADMLHVAGAKTGADRALLAGYWFQVLQRQPSFTGQQVNDALTNLGHRLANVTATFTGLQQKKPALVLQAGKSGRSQQARKQYKLTTSGVDAAKKMIAGTSSDGDA
jgi:hypothetical protein